MVNRILTMRYLSYPKQHYIIIFSWTSWIYKSIFMDHWQSYGWFKWLFMEHWHLWSIENLPM